MSSAAGYRLERRALAELGDYPVDACWSADDRALVVAGGQGALHRVDAQSAEVHLLGEHAGGALAVVWRTGSQQFASSGQDGEVRLWDARSGAAHTIHRAAAWSERLAYAANGRWLAVGTGRQVHLYDAAGNPGAQLPAHSSTIAALAWRAKGSELAALGNGGARIHRLEPQLQTREYACAGACLTASWSPDGRILASGMQDGSVHFWNIAAGTQSLMRGYGAKVALTSWSANGRSLATAADAQIVVWDFSGRGPEGSEPAQLSAHTARLTQLAFAPRGALLAAGARDRRVSLWRLTQPQQPIDAELLGDEVALLRWSMSGERLAVADGAGRLAIYAVQQS